MTLLDPAARSENVSRIQFDQITATSSLDALQGICRDSAEALHNIMVLRAMVIDADYTINQLSRALRAEVEPPILMGEPIAAEYESWARLADAGCKPELEAIPAARVEPIPGGVANEDARWTIDRAADFLEHYAAFINREVKADDIEMHPYLPELEYVASQVRDWFKSLPSSTPGLDPVGDERAPLESRDV